MKKDIHKTSLEEENFKTKKKVRRDKEVIKVVILNKSKKKLDTIKVTLYDGIASTVGEDDDMYTD